MADTQDTRARAETLAAGKQDPQLHEKAPPRPSDMPNTPSKVRGEVSVHTDTREQVNVEIDTDKGTSVSRRSTTRSGGASPKWPKDAEEWKSLAAKAAPWLAAAAIVAASAWGLRSNKEDDDGETLSHKARRSRDRAAEAADEAAGKIKRGWFGLKRRSEDAADAVGDKVEDTKRAASKKAEETKGAVKGAASRAAEAARDTADSAKQAAARVAGGTKDAAGATKQSATKGVKENYGKAKEEVKHVAGEAVDGVKHAASATGHAAYEAKEWTKDKAGDVADAARRAEHAVEDATYRGFSKGVAEAGAVEEGTGKAMRKAGERIEKSGRETKHYYRNETEPEPKRKKFLGIF